MAQDKVNSTAYASLEDKADYISGVATELAAMIPHASARMLRYLLGMVALEARLIANEKTKRWIEPTN